MNHPSPSNFALSSKRWRAGLGGMLLMVLVSMPWTGIAPDVAEQLREFFAAIVISFIAGQTVTDVVTKGRTSGSFSPGKPAAPEATPPGPPSSGHALLPVLLILTLAGAGLSTMACSKMPIFGAVAAAEERAATAQLELETVRAEKAFLEAEAAARAQLLDEAAARVAAAEAAAAAAVNDAGAHAAALALAEAARAEHSRALAEAPAQEAIAGIEARLAAAEAAAAATREAADAARSSATTAAGASGGMLGPGVGQALTSLILLGAAGAAEYGRGRALKNAAGQVA